MAKVIIEVSKNPNENNASLFRRFSRRVQESGTIPRVKSLRYNQRPKSKLATKTMTLKRITRRKEMDRMRKLGKIA